MAVHLAHQKEFEYSRLRHLDSYGADGLSECHGLLYPWKGCTPRVHQRDRSNVVPNEDLLLQLGPTTIFGPEHVDEHQEDSDGKIKTLRAQSTVVHLQQGWGDLLLQPEL